MNMKQIVQELAVTLLPATEVEPDEEMLCRCGTNCSVCTGTGTRGCHKIVADADIETLRMALSAA
jgi:hypothetical protein